MYTVFDTLVGSTGKAKISFLHIFAVLCGGGTFIPAPQSMSPHRQRNADKPNIAEPGFLFRRATPVQTCEALVEQIKAARRQQSFEMEILKEQVRWPTEQLKTFCKQDVSGFIPGASRFLKVFF